MYGLRFIWLQTFLAVIEQNGFSAAAEVMGFDQSSATRYVKELELWLGMVLFYCRSPILLTEEGAKFKVVAEQVVTQLQSSRTAQAIDRKMKPKARKPKA